jgi:hypothetical protein
LRTFRCCENEICQVYRPKSSGEIPVKNVAGKEDPFGGTKVLGCDVIGRQPLCTSQACPHCALAVAAQDDTSPCTCMPLIIDCRETEGRVACYIARFRIVHACGTFPHTKLADVH